MQNASPLKNGCRSDRPCKKVTRLSQQNSATLSKEESYFFALSRRGQKKWRTNYRDGDTTGKTKLGQNKKEEKNQEGKTFAQQLLLLWQI